MRRTDVKGVSLVELMIAFLISSMLSLAIIRHYVMVKQTYRHLMHTSDAQIEKYILSHLLREMMLGAGYYGCGKHPALLLKAYLIMKPSDKRLPTSIRRSADPKSDILYLSQMSTRQSDLSQNMQLHNMLNIKQPLDLKKNDRILLADCHQIELKTLKKISNRGRRLYFEENAKRLFKQSATLGRFDETYLYVRRTAGLYVKEGRKRAEALSQQVVSMRVREKHLSKHPLMHISLFLDNQDSLDIDMAVRNG